MATRKRISHGVRWVLLGFEAIEAYEGAREERRRREISADPDEIAMAALEDCAPPQLPVTGDSWGLPELWSSPLDSSPYPPAGPCRREAQTGAVGPRK